MGVLIYSLHLNMPQGGFECAPVMLPKDMLTIWDKTFCHPMGAFSALDLIKTAATLTDSWDRQGIAPAPIPPFTTLSRSRCF